MFQWVKWKNKTCNERSVYNVYLAIYNIHVHFDFQEEVALTIPTN